MAQENFLKGFANRYERKARLYPAFLTLLPVFSVAIGVYGMQLDMREASITFIGSLGGFYLLANIARELGKRRERALYAEWGGKPTTQLLRHRDETIDRVAKATYHSFLSLKLGFSFPTQAEEARDPGLADETYSAGTAWLLEHTRDKEKFDLLFEENIGYGYRRNALGLKPISIAVSLVAIIWILVFEGVLNTSGLSPKMLINLPVGAVGSLATSLILFFVWIFFFTKKTVKTAAFSYAETLLRASWVIQ